MSLSQVIFFYTHPREENSTREEISEADPILARILKLALTTDLIAL